MERRFALEARRVADVDDALLRLEQQPARGADALTLEPRCGRHVCVRANQRAELCLAHAAGAREQRRVGERSRLLAHARRQRLE